MSGQNDPKRAKSWTIRFNCPIQMGFIHISFSLAGVEANHYCIIPCNLFSFEQIQDIDLQMNLCLLNFQPSWATLRSAGVKLWGMEEECWVWPHPQPRPPPTVSASSCRREVRRWFVVSFGVLISNECFAAEDSCKKVISLLETKLETLSKRINSRRSLINYCVFAVWCT